MLLRERLARRICKLHGGGCCTIGSDAADAVLAVLVDMDVDDLAAQLRQLREPVAALPAGGAR